MAETTEPTTTETTTEREDRFARAEMIVEHEWAQFQEVNNTGGRAECQDNWPTFHQMRLCQFLTWPAAALMSYSLDLDAADATGRNLLTEKYARMMVTTEPERFAREISPRLPRLDPARVARQEAIIESQVAWAQDFVARYPRLGAAMRTITTAQDTLEATSLETYLRGELGTYSERTLGLYATHISALAAAGENITEQTMRFTVALSGFASLAQAEAEAEAEAGPAPSGRPI